MIMKVLCYLSLIGLVKEISTKAIDKLQTIADDQPLPELYVNDDIARELRKLFKKHANGPNRIPASGKKDLAADERLGNDETTRREKGKKRKDRAAGPEFTRGRSDQPEPPPHQHTARKGEKPDYSPREERVHSTERPTAGQDPSLTNVQRSKLMRSRGEVGLPRSDDFEKSDATHENLESFGKLKGDFMSPKSTMDSQFSEDELGSDQAAWSTDELRASNEDEASSLEHSKSSSDEHLEPGETSSSSHDESFITSDGFETASDKSFGEEDDKILEGEEEDEEEGISDREYGEASDGEYAETSEGEYGSNSEATANKSATILVDNSDEDETDLSDLEEEMDEQGFEDNPPQQVYQSASDGEPAPDSTSEELDDATDAEYDYLDYPDSNLDHEDYDNIEWHDDDVLEEEDDGGMSEGDDDIESEYYTNLDGGDASEEEHGDDDALVKLGDDRFRDSDDRNDGEEDYEFGETQDNMRGPARDDYTSGEYDDL